MSCLCDFLKLSIADRPGSNGEMSGGVIICERDADVRLVVLSRKENDLWHARTLHLRGHDDRCSVKCYKGFVNKRTNWNYG